MVPPDRATELAPAVPPVIVPPQLFWSDGTGAATNPAGKLSVKLTFGIVNRFGLVILISTYCDVSLTGIVSGLKYVFTTGGRSVTTLTSALAAWPVPASLETGPEEFVQSPADTPLM